MGTQTWQGAEKDRSNLILRRSPRPQLACRARATDEESRNSLIGLGGEILRPPRRVGMTAWLLFQHPAKSLAEMIALADSCRIFSGDVVLELVDGFALHGDNPFHQVPNRDNAHDFVVL